MVLRIPEREDMKRRNVGSFSQKEIVHKVGGKLDCKKYVLKEISMQKKLIPYSVLVIKSNYYIGRQTIYCER